MVRRRSTVRFRNGAPAQRGFSNSRIKIKRLTKRLRRGRCAALAVFVVWIVRVAEYCVHDGRTTADGRYDHVSVDGLGHMGGLVAHGVADLLERDAIAAHDRHRGVTSLMSVPVPDAGPPGHLAEPPVERVARVHAAVLVTEHEILVLPGGASGQPFGRLALPVRLERGHGALGEYERAFRLRGLDVASPARRPPHVDDCVVEVNVVPGELAQLAGAQA